MVLANKVVQWQSRKLTDKEKSSEEKLENKKEARKTFGGDEANQEKT